MPNHSATPPWGACRAVIGRLDGSVYRRSFGAKRCTAQDEAARCTPSAARRRVAFVATQDDVRRIALALPETVGSDAPFAISVLDKGKPMGFVWAWNERVHPKKARVPRDDVLAVRVFDEDEKQALLASSEEKYFTEPHYNGFPAVLVRLPAIGVEELGELIEDAWRCRAPKALREAYDRGEV